MLTGLLVFILLAVALLAVPLTLTCELSSRPGHRNVVAIGWAFGLSSCRVPLERGKKEPVKPKPEEPAKERPSGNRMDLGRGLAVIRQEGLRRRLARFAGDLWHAVDKEDVEVDLRIGLGDPADTGQLWAVVGPVAGVLQGARSARVSIVPDFVDAALEYDGRGRFRLIPLRVLYLFVALMLSAPVWRAVWAMKRPA